LWLGLVVAAAVALIVTEAALPDIQDRVVCPGAGQLVA
jgi:hypothetical protein